MKKSDILIHAGDFETMECYNELASLGNLVAVRGDTDVPEIMELLPERQVIDVEGMKVGIIHRGQLTSDNPDGLRYLAKEMGVDAILSACPFCELNLGENSEIKNMDVCELLLKAIKNEAL